MSHVDWLKRWWKLPAAKTRQHRKNPKSFRLELLRLEARETPSTSPPSSSGTSHPAASSIADSVTITDQAPSVLIAGSSATYGITANFGTSAKNATITFSVPTSGPGAPPTGVTASFSQATINASSGNTTLTVTTPSSLAAGQYPFTVNATLSNGTVQGLPEFTLVVNNVTGLSFTTPARSSEVGLKTDSITVQLVDGRGAAFAAPAAGTVVTLTSSSPDGVFRDTNDTKTITSIKIPAGANSASFLYRDLDAGKPYITASATGLTSAIQTEIIDKATPIFTGTNDVSITYGTANTTLSGVLLGNGLAPSGSVTVKIGNVKQIASINATTGAFSTSFVSGALGVSSSPYTIQFGYAGDDKFDVASDTASLTVVPKTLTVTAKSASKIYGDLDVFAGTEFTAAGLLNGDTIGSVTLASNGGDSTATVAGSPYAITPSAAVGAGLGNYTITYVKGSLTVTPKSLTVTAKNASKTYGDVASFSGTEFAASGLVNSDTVDKVMLASSGTVVTATVGSSPYAITPSAAVGAGLGNYTINYVKGSLSVNPKGLTVTAKNVNKVYGDVATFAGTEFVASGLINGDTVSSVALTSSGGVVSATVGGSPYAISASAAVGTGLTNYAIVYLPGNMTVTTKALTITPKSATKVYGDPATFAGSEFTAAGLVNGDIVNNVTLATNGSDVTATVGASPYAINASAANGAGLDNYTITYAKGSLTVTPKGLTVTASNASKVYGNPATFSGSEFTSTGLINGDSVSNVSLSSSGADVAAAVAPYPIIASAAAGSGLGNYAITYIKGSLTVTPKDLTVVAKNLTKVYGDTLTFAGSEFTTTGLINGDAVSSVTLTSDGAASTATVSDTPYTIAASAAAGSGLGNYAIVYAPGHLTITPKLLTITAKNTNKTYGDVAAFAGTEFTTSGLINGDTVTQVSLASGGAAVTANVANSPYAITASAPAGSGLKNYTFKFVDGKLTVAPKNVTIAGIAANDKSFDNTTAATLNVSAATVVGLINGDVVTANVSAATGKFTDSEIGTAKTVRITGVTLAGPQALNYAIAAQPTATASITGSGDVVINGTPGNDSLTLSGSPGNGAITFVLNGGKPVSLTGVRSFTFNGGAGNDTMTLVLPPTIVLTADPVTFNGGAGTNSLIVQSNTGPVRTLPSSTTAAAIYGSPQSITVSDVATTTTVTSLTNLSARQSFSVMFLSPWPASRGEYVPPKTTPVNQFAITASTESLVQVDPKPATSWYTTFLNRPTPTGTTSSWVAVSGRSF